MFFALTVSIGFQEGTSLSGAWWLIYIYGFYRNVIHNDHVFGGRLAKRIGHQGCQESPSQPTHPHIHHGVLA